MGCALGSQGSSLFYGGLCTPTHDITSWFLPPYLHLSGFKRLFEFVKRASRVLPSTFMSNDLVFVGLEVGGTNTLQSELGSNSLI